MEDELCYVCLIIIFSPCRVTVARPAPIDAPVKEPDYSGITPLSLYLSLSLSLSLSYCHFNDRLTFLCLIPGFAGPRYNEEGAPIPHSLLGSYDEFRKEAIKRGDLLVGIALC